MTVQSITPVTIFVTEAELERFLAGEAVPIQYADADGCGRTVWADEAAEEFDADEVAQLRGSGMEFWFEHPVTGKQVSSAIVALGDKS